MLCIIVSYGFILQNLIIPCGRKSETNTEKVKKMRQILLIFNFYSYCDVELLFLLCFFNELNQKLELNLTELSKRAVDMSDRAIEKQIE